MTIIKRMVCLANSRKLQGRCIGGCEIAKEGAVVWIRPVSDRPHEEVSEYERQYEDGSDLAVLDILDVPLLGSHPKSYQQENWLIDPGKYWMRVGTFSWTELKASAVKNGTLWLNGHHTYHGMNDVIPIEERRRSRVPLS